MSALCDSWKPHDRPGATHFAQPSRRIQATPRTALAPGGPPGRPAAGLRGDGADAQHPQRRRRRECHRRTRPAVRHQALVARGRRRLEPRGDARAGRHRGRSRRLLHFAGQCRRAGHGPRRGLPAARAASQRTSVGSCTSQYSVVCSGLQSEADMRSSVGESQVSGAADIRYPKSNDRTRLLPTLARQRLAARRSRLQIARS